jgi:very-short-patch-repair endonuclease
MPTPVGARRLAPPARRRPLPNASSRAPVALSVELRRCGVRCGRMGGVESPRRWDGKARAATARGAPRQYRSRRDSTRGVLRADVFCPTSRRASRRGARSVPGCALRRIEWTVRPSRILRRVAPCGGLRPAACRAEGGVMLGRCARQSPRRSELLAGRAALMRGCPTSSEALLWSALRGRRLGVRFVRQAVVGRFIVDFLAREARLVVEVDGRYHAGRRKADARRDAMLARWGYRVVRVDAELVERRLLCAVGVVAAALHAG